MEISKDLIERFWQKVDKTSECWNWTGATNPAGYGRFKVADKMVYPHRYVMALNGYEVTGSDVVCHKCDNPACVNPDHLFIGSHKDNADDMVRKGRDHKARGEAHYNAKLTEDDVSVIRRSRGKITQGRLAQIFDVPQPTISRIQTGKLWKHTTA